jgi:acyl-CoA reductase-like NAD-dependent aldehyde dehydrogenase
MIHLDERLIPSRAPMTATRLKALARTLRAGGTGLRDLPESQRLAALDRVAASWLAGDSAWRRQALVELPMSTGFPRAAIETALDNLWTALQAPHLTTTLQDELANRDGQIAPAPGLALHVLAGNVPGVGVFGIVAALLAGVPSLVKPAAREPFLPTLLVDSIAAVAPELRRAVAVAPWRGGTADLDATAVAEADLVLAYGRDDTLDRLAARHPRRLLRFGQRLSVALIARSALTRETAAALARQIALFDQQGCLSPQLACVEECAPADGEHFANLVAEELERLQRELPPAALTLAESAAIWRFLEQQRWRAQEGAAVVVHGGHDGLPSVVCDRTPDWSLGPTFRHLVLVPVPSLADAAAVLRPFTGVVEATGYAGPTHRLREASDLAASCGAHRLCPLERMQAPPFAWRQSGHARLACFTGLAATGDPDPTFA